MPEPTPKTARLRDYRAASDLQSIRACLVDLQNFARELDPRAVGQQALTNRNAVPIIMCTFVAGSIQEQPVFDDPDIKLFTYVFVIGAIVVALIWFLFVVPAERRYHERKLKAVQEQIRRREEMLNDTSGTATREQSGHER